MNKMKYIKPVIEVVLLKDRLMLELPVSNYEIPEEDEAAKKGMFDQTDWDSQESIWGKPSSKDQNWDEWSGN